MVREPEIKAVLLLLLLRRIARAGHGRAAVRAGDGHGLVLHLTRSCRNVLLDVLLRSSEARARGLRRRRLVVVVGIEGRARVPAGRRADVETGLLHLGRRALDADRRRLQLEGLGLGEATRVLGAIGALGVAVFGSGQRVDVARVTNGGLPAITRSERRRAEAGSVGRRLRAKLGEVQIGAGAVADGHGPPELAFRPEAVEDNAVDDDCQRLDHDLDDAADKGPVLVAMLVCLLFATKRRMLTWSLQTSAYETSCSKSSRRLLSLQAQPHMSCPPPLALLEFRIAAPTAHMTMLKMKKATAKVV